MENIYHIIVRKMMPMRKRILSAVVAFVCCMSFGTAWGQVVVLSENFEHGGSMPSGWTQTYSSPEWQMVSSGIGGSTPSSAHAGTYCAGMYYDDSDCDFNELLTPYMNLSAYSSATLTFYLHKQDWASDADDLSVYYRNSNGGTWTLLNSYTSSISSWTLQTINLPSLSANYQIKFRGNACYGYGIYIDDVVVTGYTSGGGSCSSSFNMASGLTRTIECGTTYCFYDSGGESGQYSNSESMTATFTSTGSITLTFTSFNTESNYDKITVYDGTTSGTILLNEYSGTTLPSQVTATSGRMTIVWTSDTSVPKDGWVATVTATGCGGSTNPTDCITIGTGTTCSNVYAPINDFWNYGYRQIIYPASSLTAGTITSISFQYCYTTAMSSKNSVNIYMGTTTQSAFSSTDGWIPLSNLTLVYSGAMNCTTGWNTFTLAAPFDYNGTDNLVVAIDDNSGNYDGSSYTFYYTTGSSNVMLYYTSDGTNPDPASPPTGSFAANYPNTQFCISNDCTQPTGTFALNPSTINVTQGNTYNISNCLTNQLYPTGTLSYTSLNPSVATVTSSGVITGVSEGTATIRIEYTSSDSDYCSKVVNLVVNVTDGCVRIGDGTSCSYTYGPVNNFYKYGYYQYIFPMSTGAGDITSIGFQYCYETAMTSKTNVNIYMGQTTNSAFASATSWIPLSDLTLVYSGPLNCSSGWNSFALTTPFYYDGTSNLVIAIDDNSNAYNGTSYTFYYTAGTGNSVLYYYNDGTDVNPASPPSGTVAANYPNTKICIEDCTQRTLTFSNSNVNITSCTGTTSQQYTLSPVTGGDVTWTSSNPSVASVSSTGVVTAHSSGTVVITARVSSYNGYCGASGSYSVTVTGSSHRLTYNTTAGCSGTASAAPASVTGTSAVVTATEPTCSSLPYFIGWNTASNGTGTPYTAGSTVDLGCADVTLYAIYSDQPPVITGSSDCESAMAFCATNENTGYDLTVESNNPSIESLDGMCSFFDNPTWWYLRVSQSGPIHMTISSCGDVDFGCWGPFDNPTCDITNDLSTPSGLPFSYYSSADQASYYGPSYNGVTPTSSTTTSSAICSTYALAEPVGNLVDFGGSTSAVEYLQIQNAVEGEIYVLLVANFANCAGEISITQSNIAQSGAGRSDCTIVNDCNITSVTTIVGDCEADQTFTVSGNINFTDPPVDGTLTISDGSVSQVFYPPFVSPIAYTLSGIVGDNQEHTIRAAFVSSSTNCERITYINAPMCEINCPDATVAMTGYTEEIGGRYYFDVCLGSGVNMGGVQTGYTNPTWRWSVNPHGGIPPYVVTTQDASYTPDAQQGYDISLTVTEGYCSSVAHGRIRVSNGLDTNIDNFALGDICVGDSRPISVGGTGSDIEVAPEPYSIETSLGHAETTFIPDGLNCTSQCYESSVTFYDFDDGAVVTNTDAIKYVRINTEHSFIGDIQIKITCPERNGIRRSAILLPDYYSNDPNSNVYSGNAIDAYTYTWPDVTATTSWHVGSSSTSYYTGDNMIGRTYNAPEGATYSANGYTYYLLTFATAEDAWNYVHSYLEQYFPGHEYTVYSINSGSYYAIAYTVTDDNGTTRYYVWMTNDSTTGNDAYSFTSQAAAQYYVNTVLGGNGVVSSYTNTLYTRIYFGEPDIYDVVDSENLTSAEICDGSNPHNIPGHGYDYAWTSNSQYTTVGYVYDVSNMSATTTVYNNGTASSNTLHHVLPSNVENGTQMYQPYQNFGSLIGCPLNGVWTISVCDSWSADNGYVFDWEIALSEDLLPSNWDYTVELESVSNDCGSISTVSGNNIIVAPQTATNGQQSCNIILTDNLGCTTDIPMTYTAVAPTITHVTTSGNELQTVCEGQPITDIVYTLGGVATGAVISWTPSTPDGVTLNVSGNTVTVSGAPALHDTYNYTITTVSQTGLRCTEQVVTGRIIVNEGNIVPTFTQAGPYCEGSTVNALPTTSNNGITGHWEPDIMNRTYTYTFVPDPGQCATITTMQITVNPLPTLQYTSGDETLCGGETNANIVFTYGGGANGADVINLPAGMTFETYPSENRIVISGVPTVGAGTYPYTITTTGATSPCTNISETRNITIVDPATLVLTTGTETQTICEGGEVNFVYTYGGAAGGAEVVGSLPAGLTSSVNTANHTITISGHPSENGTFTVSTTNETAPCGNHTLTGRVIINPPAELTLLSGSPDAVLCVEITWTQNIRYSFGGSATGIDLVALNNDLPDGITASVSGNVVTISGTPALTVEAGDYTYTITTTGAEAPCENISRTGVISISTNATLVLTSAAGTDNQNICMPGTFTNIVYTYGGGATGIDEDALRNDLPAGLSFTVNHTAQTVTIYGTPTETGVFPYTVITTGIIPPCKPEEKQGTITLRPSAELEIAGNANQNFCLGSSLSDIVFTYGGGATDVAIVGGTLPDGINAISDAGNHTMTLSGTPVHAGTFTFNVTTTGAISPCTDVVIPVSITVYETPDVSITASADEICNGSSVSMTSAPATFTSYRWTCNTTSDATHTITTGMPTSSTSSSVNVSPTVTPGSADVVYVLRVTDANTCTATVSHTVNVSSIATAEIAKVDNTKCIEPYNGTITVSNFAGGTAGSTYTVTVSGHAAQTSTGTAVTFNNLAPGTYTVRITNETTSANCYTEQDIVVGDTPTTPTVSISGSLSICDGTSTTLTAHGANGLAEYTYRWSNGATSAEIVTPNLYAQTPYTVTVTDANNCTAENTVNVVIGDTPAVEVTADNACLNDAIVLQAHVSNAGTGYTVTWEATPSAAAAGLLTTTGERITVTPTSADSYTYTATLHANSCGTSGTFDISDDETITVYPLPTPSITPSTAVINCSNNSQVSAVADGGVSYVWSNSTNTANSTFNSVGFYQVTVTDANGCSATTEIEITGDFAEPNLDISLNPNTTEITCTDNSIKIIASTDTDGAHLEMNGVTVSNPFVQMVDATMVDPVTGVYVFEITSVAPNGCTHTETVEITRDINTPTVSISQPATTTLNCTTGSINLTAIGTGTMVWTPSNVATHANYPADGNYIVTTSFDNGCTASAMIHIDRDVTVPVPHISPSTTEELTLNCNIHSIALVASVESGNATYAWYQGPHEATYNVLEPGVYTVTATLANGCTASTNVEVFEDADLPSVSIVPPAVLTCTTQSIELTVQTSPAGIALSWANGVDPTNITEPGQYRVTATAPNGCSRSAAVTVSQDIVKPNVAITQPATTVLTCYNSYNNIPITLNATTTTDGASLSWTNGTLDVLAPGVYPVTAIAPNGCDSTTSIEITEDVQLPNVLIGNNSNTNVITCAGPSISVTLIDDSDADIYTWSGGENTTGTGNSFTSAGTYYVTATSPNGCTAMDQITITTDLAEPSVDITNNTNPVTTTLTCDVSTIYVTAVGSSRVVSYRWSGGSYTNQAPNELTTIGHYVVTVTADNGCTATNSIDIDETMGRPHVEITAPNTTLTCAITQVPITASGDAVSYAWSGGLYPNVAANTVNATGTYTVTATASNGCTAVNAVTITENITPPTVTIRNDGGFNEINCNSTSVHAIATGTGVSYTWPGGYEGAEINLTVSGTYTVTAYGSNGCSNTAYMVITEDLTPPTPVITSINSVYTLDCNHDEITLNAAGGLSYEWSTGQTGSRITINTPGTYRVTAIGRNGCPGESEIVIDEDRTQPSVHIDNITGSSDLTCTVTEIEIIAQGGTSFAWSNQLWGGGPQQVIRTPGTYRVSVTGANGCVGTDEITVRSDIDPPTVDVNSITDSFELNCNVSQINVTAYGNGIEYAWSGGANSTGYTNSFVGAGTYTVTSTGFNGCTNTATFTITSNHAAPDINISNETGTNVIDCNTPQIHVVMTGQNATYQWSDGYTTSDRTFYSVGEYSVTATGTNGCTASASIGITEDNEVPNVTITNNTGSTELNCFNTSIAVTANGGQSYVWDDGTMSPSNTFSSPGTYTVVATAANGCTNSTVVVISQAATFAAEISSIGTINCYGGTTTATVSPLGGNPSYSYEWSDGQRTQTAVGLSAGNYTVTVSDSGGCNVALQCTINQPMELVATVASRDLICGVSRGSLSAVVVGGTQPYSYIWSNGITAVDNTDLAVGQYAITVSDANNCMATATAQIMRQGILSVDAHVTQQISCHGSNDGIIAAECPNAAAPLSYTWSTGNASPEIYNLFAGSYMVTVSDAWGCTGQAGANLVSPPEMNLQTYIETPLCHDSQDGKIIATAFGGVAPYSYLWNTSSNETELNNLGMGTYSLTITDAAGCSAVKSVVLEAPAALVVETVTNEIKCNGDKNGRIEVNVSGGVEPYSYSIDDLARPTTNNLFSNMIAGYYMVRVVDNNGCEANKPTLLSQPEALHIETVYEDPFCRSSRTGSIEIRVNGGTEPYLYYWNNSKADVSIMQNIPAGDYVVGVIDANECKSEEITITLTDVDVPCLRIPNVFTPNGDGVNDAWLIENIEMFPAAEVYIFNRWGQLMFTSKGYTEPWDGSYRGHFVPAGTYMYVIDLFNDEEPYEGTVTILY